MNEKEKLVLQLIKDNPFISQLELANAVNLSRSTVANIISGLIKKEYVSGKAYVLNEVNPIICIGGVNVDRKFYVTQDIVEKTSNPVTSSRSVGGVARNIAENLGRLGEDIIMLSAAGNDSDWKEIYDLSSPFMNLDYVTQFEDAATGSYTAVLDKHGDMFTALADMNIYDRITPELLSKNSNTLQKAKCIVADLNCPKETIDFLSSFTLKYQIPFVIVPVSSPKMNRLPKNLQAVHWLILNKDETETFFNIQINNQQDFQKAIENWLNLGVKNVIVTDGANGVAASGKDGQVHFYPAIKAETVVDVTGAGDAFCSAVIHSWLHKKSHEDVISSGMVNAYKTLSSKYTVRQELSKHQLEFDMEELQNESIH
ncbi:carbohydrate kinase [Lentibacillus sp. N15]|uniref:carbohydrate kinase n=1 Tax=Lentibacillus songyuanensis TaxID=3136161 RepID=UPI0031BB7ADA